MCVASFRFQRYRFFIFTVGSVLSASVVQLYPQVFNLYFPRSPCFRLFRFIRLFRAVLLVVVTVVAPLLSRRWWNSLYIQETPEAKIERKTTQNKHEVAQIYQAKKGEHINRKHMKDVKNNDVKTYVRTCKSEKSEKAYTSAKARKNRKKKTDTRENKHNS